MNGRVTTDLGAVVVPPPRRTRRWVAAVAILGAGGVSVAGCGNEGARKVTVAEDAGSAEHLRAATAAEEDAARLERSESDRPPETPEPSPEPTTDPSPTTAARRFVAGAPVLVSGRSGDVDWDVTVAASAENPRGPTMCFEIEDAGTCFGLAEAPTLDPLNWIDFKSDVTAFNGHTVTWGRAAADVTRVRIEVAGHAPVEADTVVAEGFNGRFYATDIGMVTGPATFVAFDASGAELGRRTKTVPEPRPSVGG